MIAVIAGTGSLPISACESLIQSNKKFFVLSLFPEDNIEKLKTVTKNYAEVKTQKFFKAAKILKLLKEKNISQVLLIGKVDKRNLLKKIKFDWFAIKTLASLIMYNDRDIMERILKAFSEHNIKVIPQSEILADLFVKPGVLTGKLTKEIEENIDMGLKIAEKLSINDIGQTVIVKNKMILAVEAIEGTDNCIKRGIELGKKNIIICKSANKKQNEKYDLPTLGPETLANIKNEEILAIAWKANQTFIADKEKFIEDAKKLNITLIAV